MKEIKVEKDVILIDSEYYLKMMEDEIKVILESLECNERKFFDRVHELNNADYLLSSYTVQLEVKIIDFKNGKDIDIDSNIKAYNDACNNVIREIINKESNLIDMRKYKKICKIETNSIIKIKELTYDMYNDILPFIKQMKYNSTVREIILYDGSDLKLSLSKGLSRDDGVNVFCNDIYLIIEANSDYLPLDLEYDFNISTILETVTIDTMYNTYLKLEHKEYEFETYCNKIRFIIYTLYISLSADYVVERLLSKVHNIEKEIGELRKVD